MTLTSRLMVAGCAQLSPLCPGSTTITWPASGEPGAVAPAEGTLAGELAGLPGPVVTRCPAAALPDAGAGAPEQAASRPARAPAAVKAAATRTGRRPFRRTRSGPESLQARPTTQLKGNIPARRQVS